MRTFLLVSVFALLLGGCSNDVSMIVPGGGNGADGQPGLQGESAYTGWVNAVERGDIEWSEDTDAAGFFRFLKGADGENGISGVDGLDGDDGGDGDDGINGVDGKTAYQLWVEAVGRGLDDPHNPGTQWDKNETSMSDFFRFLMGKDGMNGMSGLSAYGLWVRDVQDGDGLENPHSPGTRWPVGQTTVLDFWHYLRGEDGEDGEDGVVPPAPGSPGAEVTPVAGKTNVIALYRDQRYSEYVSTANGGVTYQVYLDDGSKAGAGVVVTEMPGMPNETFTTLDDGTFRVSKGQLPTSGSSNQRFGTSKVDGTVSAANTYVPQKIDVRLVIGNGSYLLPELRTTSNNDLNGGIYMDIPVRVQRKVTSEGEWEDLPLYLTDVERTVRAYAIDNSNVDDPTAPNMSAMMPHRVNTAQNLRGATVGVRRPTVKVDWIDEQVQIDEYYMYRDGITPEAFTMVLDDTDGFYGENPHTNAVIMTAPVNFHPLPTQLEMGSWASGGTDGTLEWTGGSFDVTHIVDEYLFVSRYSAYETDAFTYYTRGNDAADNKCLAVSFGSTDSQIGDPNKSSIGDPSYTMSVRVPIGSYVYLKPASLLIAGPGNTTPIGRLILDPGTPGEYIIRAEYPFTFADIQIL